MVIQKEGNTTRLFIVLLYHHSIITLQSSTTTQMETPSMITLMTLSFPCRTNSKASSACSNLNRFVMSLLTSILPLAIRSTAVG